MTSENTNAALDTKRLDWLMAQDNCVVQSRNGYFWLCWLNESGHDQFGDQSAEYLDPRSAIDEAMRAENFSALAKHKEV